MMLRQHTGRGTAPVHPDWGVAPAAIVAATLPDVVAIGPATGGQEWSETEEQYVPIPGTPVYTGPAQLTPVTDADGNVDLSAEDPVNVRNYRITLPAAADAVVPGHLVRVTSSTDSALAGRRLTVDAIEYGGRRFARHLFAHLLDEPAGGA